MDEEIKRKREYWKWFPFAKKGGIAMLADALIDQCEREDFKNLTADWLARKIGVSESYLSRCYKDHYKTSLHRDIVRHKMVVAKELLVKYPRASMNRVAEMLDYSDGNYFIKVFKKACKMTPHQYRKKTIEEDKAFESVKITVRWLRQGTGIKIPRSAMRILKILYLKMRNEGLLDHEIDVYLFEEKCIHYLEICTCKNSKKISCSYKVPLEYEDI